MPQHFKPHPACPQPRLIRQAAEIIRAGGVLAYPTDSSYALGCAMGNKTAMERIRRLRQVGEAHNFTLVCQDLSELSQYAQVDNVAYRLLKRFTPGPYTFILAATRQVPRRLQNPKRRSIGLRVPDYPIVTAMLAQLGEPLMSSTLIMPGEALPLNEPTTILERVGAHIDLLVDGGPCDWQPTTVVDLTTDAPQVLRQGKGDSTAFAAA